MPRAKAFYARKKRVETGTGRIELRIWHDPNPGWRPGGIDSNGELVAEPSYGGEAVCAVLDQDNLALPRGFELRIPDLWAYLEDDEQAVLERVFARIATDGLEAITKGE